MSASARRAVGLAVCFGGLAISFAGLNAFTWITQTPSSFLGFGPLPQFVGIVLAVLWMLGGGAVFSYGQEESRHARAAAAVTLDAASDLEGDFVLYLRPFDVDRLLARPQSVPLRGMPPFSLDSFLISGKTEEEQLVDVVAPAGHLVAVASPRGTRRVAGASWTFLRQGDWKPQVRRLIERARFIVICLGPSDSIAWETAEVLSTVSPERFAIISPLDRDDYLKSWQLVADHYENRTRDLAMAVGATEVGAPRLAFPDFAGGYRDPATRDHSIEAVVYYDREHGPHYVRLDSMKQTGLFAANRSYARLEDAFRPLLRRLVEFDEIERPPPAVREFRLEEQENWYHDWSRGVLMFVIVGVAPGLFGTTMSVLAFGWQDTYSLAAVALTAVPPTIMGIVIRRQMFPPSSYRASAYLIFAGLAFFSLAVFVSSLTSFPSVRVPVWFVPVIFATLCLAGLAITTVEGLLDYLMAALLALILCSGYAELARLLPSDGNFVATGQIALVFLVAAGTSAYLFKRRPERLTERVGIAEAAFLALALCGSLVGLTWTALPREPANFLTVPLVGAGALLGGCVLLRLVLARTSVDQTRKFAILLFVIGTAQLVIGQIGG